MSSPVQAAVDEAITVIHSLVNQLLDGRFLIHAPSACETMHELSIAMSILDLAEEESQKHGSARILGIHLKLGCLSGVVKEALLSAYQLAREQTPFEETELMIEEVPALVHCPTCQSHAGRRVCAEPVLC